MTTAKDATQIDCPPRRATRWKGMAGAVVAMAVASTGAHAGQIDLSGDFVSSSGVINLSADLTSGPNPLIEVRNVESNADFKEVLLFNFQFSSTHLFDAETSNAEGAAPYSISLGTFFLNSLTPITATETVPVTFADPLINGGALTNGSLEATAITGPTSEEIEFGTLTYGPPIAIPEPASWVLALLCASSFVYLRRRALASRSESENRRELY